MGKYYAVKVGWNPGIYMTWPECQKEIKGFPRAVYKSFDTKEKAEEFLNEIDKIMHYDGVSPLPAVHMFVDGSYNAKTGYYGFGGYISVNGERTIFSDCGNDEEIAKMRNFSAELLAAKLGIQTAYNMGIREITIVYDCEAIGQIGVGSWGAKNQVSKDYKNFVEQAKKAGMKLKFMQVDGHTNIAGNEVADQIAKRAAGITKGNTEFMGIDVFGV